MAWFSSTLRRIRSHITTLNGRGSSLRTQSSHGRFVDKKTIIPPNPLANSARSPSSDGVVDSSPNPIANHFRSDGGLVSKTIISSDPLAKSVRSDVVGDSKVISSDLPVNHFISFANRNNKTSELCANYMRSLSLSRVVENKSIISSDPLPKVELIPDVETVQASSNNSSDPLANVELIPDDTFSPVDTVQTGSTLHIWGETVEDDIHYAVLSTKSFINHVLFCEEHSEVVYKAFDVISNHSIFETCSVDTKLKILSTVFDQIQNNSQADAREVYLMNAFLRSMSNRDSNKGDLTKKEVMSRVIYVIQSYPKVGKRQVGKKTRFGKDLGFSLMDSSTVHKALYLEFRLKVEYMQHTGPSCREISDYIYDNRMKRMEFENFRARNISGHLFWPRYIYVL